MNFVWRHKRASVDAANHQGRGEAFKTVSRLKKTTQQKKGEKPLESKDKTRRADSLPKPLTKRNEQ